MLVAALGTGRTVTALSAAKSKIEKDDISNIIVISDRKILQDQWRHVARDFDINLDTEITTSGYGSSLTYQLLNNRQDEFIDLVTATKPLVIFDEIHRYSKKAEILGDLVLSQNSESKLYT